MSGHRVARQEYGFLATLVEVKTTLELPDDLLRELKLRAVQEDRRLKDVVEEALRRYLDRRPAPTTGDHRVSLPLVHCEPADPALEVTPERAAALLLAEETPRSPRP